MGTSAIGLLNFKQRLKDKQTESFALENTRKRENISIKTTKRTKTKRGVTEENINLPVWYSPVSRQPHPSARYQTRRDDHSKSICISFYYF